jgi:DNA-binding NtrC family response regulator
MTELCDHDWPGNVRELENVVERALIRSPGDTLRLDMPVGDESHAVGPLPRTGTSDAEGQTLDDVQRAHIEYVLAQCGGRINGRANAAERLGLHPNTLRFRMKKLGIGPRRAEGQASTRRRSHRPGDPDGPLEA